MARLYSDASFLFSPEVRQFMEHELGGILANLETIRAVIRQRGGKDIPDESSLQWFDLRSCLNELIGGGIEKVFAPYLDFSDIR